MGMGSGHGWGALLSLCQSLGLGAARTLLRVNDAGTGLTFASPDGIWTPALVGGTTPGTNTYSEQVGYYTRHHNLVLASFRVTVTAKPVAMVGAIRISGLPFAAGQGTHVNAVMATAVTHPAGFTSLMVQTLNGQTYMTLTFAGSNNTPQTAAPGDFGATPGVYGTILYLAA